MHQLRGFFCNCLLKGGCPKQHQLQHAAMFFFLKWAEMDGNGWLIYASTANPAVYRYERKKLFIDYTSSVS